MIYPLKAYGFLLPLIPLLYYFFLEGFQGVRDSIGWFRKSIIFRGVFLFFLVLIISGNSLSSLRILYKHHTAQPQFDFSLLNELSEKTDSHWNQWHDGFL